MYFYMLTLPDIYMSNTSPITTYPMRRKYQKYIWGVVGAEKNIGLGWLHLPDGLPFS